MKTLIITDFEKLNQNINEQIEEVKNNIMWNKKNVYKLFINCL